MKNLFIATLLCLTTSAAWACPLPAGSYNCNNAPIFEIGKNNVVIKSITISNDQNNSSIWNANGDIWVSDGNNSGQYENQDFHYAFNLTPGTHLVENNIFTSSVCDVNPAGIQVYWSTFIQYPNQNPVYVSRVTFTGSVESKELHVSIDRTGERFTCTMGSNN